MPDFPARGSGAWILAAEPPGEQWDFPVEILQNPHWAIFGADMQAVSRLIFRNGK